MDIREKNLALALKFKMINWFEYFELVRGETHHVIDGEFEGKIKNVSLASHKKIIHDALTTLQKESHEPNVSNPEGNRSSAS